MVLSRRFFATRGVLLVMKTLEDERYVVIKAYKFTISEILRDFLGSCRLWRKMANIAFVHKGKIFTPFMPLCIKGKFYAIAVVMYITTAFYAMGFGVKSPCEMA